MENPMTDMRLPSAIEVADISPKFVPPNSEKPSRKEVGKMRKAYLTRVLPEVTACGHRLDTQRMPSNNCEACWYAYFKTSVDLVALHAELSEEAPIYTDNGFKLGRKNVGKDNLTKKYGAKFTKMFGRFLASELKGTDGI
jgi:hypothetical protein